ncbi:MAG: hypothetical protein OXE94_00220 [Aestuariivita sp.]|nr:hypothetical protein [Aestuariivita sp.]MCY4202106.1 hypothetical protein [Aestuariivita sp.]
MIQDDGRKIQCTQQLSGTSRLEWLTDFDGKKIFQPSGINDRPKENHLARHRKNVFRA